MLSLRALPGAEAAEQPEPDAACRSGRLCSFSPGLSLVIHQPMVVGRTNGTLRIFTLSHHVNRTTDLSGPHSVGEDGLTDEKRLTVTKQSLR